MRVGVVAMVAAAVLLAGCSGENDAAASPSASDGEGAASSTPPTPSSAPAGENTPPTGTLEASNLTGPAPLLINFTIGASDPDGDNVTWSLDADGDGASDADGDGPTGAANFTYGEMGEFVASLSVSDGAGSATVNLTVNVTAVAAGAGITQTVSGSFALGAEGCGSWAAYDTSGGDPMAPTGGDLNETTRVEFAVNPATYSLPYMAAYTFDQGYLFLNVAFYDADGTLLSSDVNDTAAFGNGEVTGTVADGAVRGVLFACGGPTSASVVYTA